MCFEYGFQIRNNQDALSFRGATGILKGNKKSVTKEISPSPFTLVVAQRPQEGLHAD